MWSLQVTEARNRLLCSLSLGRLALCGLLQEMGRAAGGAGGGGGRSAHPEENCLGCLLWLRVKKGSFGRKETARKLGLSVLRSKVRVQSTQTSAVKVI